MLESSEWIFLNCYISNWKWILSNRSSGGTRLAHRNSDRSNGLVYFMVTLCFMLFILLMIPSLIEPPVLYIGVVFSLLSLIFIIGFINSYLKSKRSHTSNSSVEVDRRLSNDSNNFSNLIRYDVSDEQHNNGSQLSVLSSDLPPKYELPPSYSQTIYSINI